MEVQNTADLLVMFVVLVVFKLIAVRWIVLAFWQLSCGEIISHEGYFKHFEFDLGLGLKLENIFSFFHFFLSNSLTAPASLLLFPPIGAQPYKNAFLLFILYPFSSFFLLLF